MMNILNADEISRSGIQRKVDIIVRLDRDDIKSAVINYIDEVIQAKIGYHVSYVDSDFTYDFSDNGDTITGIEVQLKAEENDNN